MIGKKPPFTSASDQSNYAVVMSDVAATPIPCLVIVIAAMGACRPSVAPSAKTTTGPGASRVEILHAPELATVGDQHVLAYEIIVANTGATSSVLAPKGDSFLKRRMKGTRTSSTLTALTCSPLPM